MTFARTMSIVVGLLAVVGLAVLLARLAGRPPDIPSTVAAPIAVESASPLARDLPSQRPG